jgi:hypothetical protein
MVQAADDVKPFPIIEEGTETYAASIATLFQDYGCVVVRINTGVAPKTYDNLCSLFLTALYDCGGKKKRLGPCARLGLMTAGGLPFSEFANK